MQVDYKEQAAKAAKNYLDIAPFSRAGMIQQLSSDAGDGYTKAQQNTVLTRLDSDSITDLLDGLDEMTARWRQ